jgi:hypothetical protein
MASSKHYQTQYFQNLLITSLKDADEAEQLGLPARVDLELRRAMKITERLGNQQQLHKHLAGRHTLLWMHHGYRAL